LAEIKKLVDGVIPAETSNFSQGIMRMINNYIEMEKNELTRKMEAQRENEIKAKNQEIIEIKNKFIKVINNKVDEINKTSSEDAHKILPVLGEMLREFEKI
jgi:septum formation topological specificity factor MinE